MPLGDELAAHLLASVPTDERDDCWWIVLTDGSPVRGDRGGGVLVLSQIRVTRPLGRLLAFLGLSPGIDLFDKVLARWRGRLSRFVPDGPAIRLSP